MNITPNGTKSFNYTYGKDNFLEKFTMGTNRSVNYAYDGLGRLTSSTLTTTNPITMSYLYKLSDRNTGTSDIYRTTKVYKETIGDDVFCYTYDKLGNITKIQKVVNGVGTTLYTYEYDSFGQLIYERDYIQNLSRHYDFDEGGNLWSETINSYEGSDGGSPTRTETIYYGYSDKNWTDKMTSYKGQTITYDAIGNPLSYRDVMTMTWQNGRQLASLQKGNNNIQYSYDSEGIRVSKTINGEKCTFEYLNGMLLYETRGEKYFHYYYDSNGTLYAVDYKLSSADTSTRVYYFTHNWRGDIVGIYNGNGDLRAKYEYDSWGNVTSITDGNGNAITDQNHIANLNPFRYRGYYMDTETGMYYLMSRYYDPVTHRFVNADGYFQTGTGVLDANMNAYCGNNPVNRSDYTGEFWGVVLIGALIGGLVSAGLDVASQLMTGTSVENLNWGSVLIEGLTGAAYGALISSMGLLTPNIGVPSMGKLLLTKSTINAANSLAHSYNNGDDIVTATNNVALSTLSTYATAAASDYIPSRTYSDSLFSQRVVKTSYQPEYQTISSYKKVVKKSLTSFAFDTGKRIKNNFMTIGKTKYKVCSQCGCPHIIVQ